MSKGLGTGLGALFGDNALEEPQTGGAYLPISKVEPRRDQPRSRFDEAALNELAGSIAEHGVIQPLTVRKLEDGYFQIIAGERRWRAARMAGLKEVPVRVIEADDKKAMELALVENLQREDLNPAEEARGYKALIEEYGLTQEETAVKVGKSRPVIANALRILSLPKPVLLYIEEGKLTLSQARAILTVEGDANRLDTAEHAVKDSLTVREIDAHAKKLAKRSLKPKFEQKEEEVDYVAEVEKKLSNHLGRKIKITCGNKNGKIEIEYYGSDDFEQLCDALNSINAGDKGGEA
ncbi:MAG: ParB/RepB/Spo0J family partition protein [Clostridia bacterium]|nr:ParB/RepB/Spo0J family partition protein [Clostridia bacterium]